MKINYCLPIRENDKKKIFRIIQENNKDYQFFEIWLDYIDNIDESFIIKITRLLKQRLILVFRRENLDEIKMPLAKRLKIILIIARTQSFVDLDISQKDELIFLKKNSLKINLLLSYHNYQETPDNQKIQTVLEEMKKHKPLIYKISTNCTEETDAIRLLQVQKKLQQEKKKHIILGMGKFGTITRVFATLWGNEMIFAPKSLDKASAKGQLTKKKLEVIFMQLEP